MTGFEYMIFLVLIGVLATFFTALGCDNNNKSMAWTILPAGITILFMVLAGIGIYNHSNIEYKFEKVCRVHTIDNVDVFVDETLVKNYHIHFASKHSDEYVVLRVAKPGSWFFIYYYGGDSKYIRVTKEEAADKYKVPAKELSVMT